MDRLRGMERGKPIRDLEYLDSLSQAVQRGVAYGIELLAHDEAGIPHPPLALITQARLAARHRIPLETTLQGYIAAKQLFVDFMLEEATKIPACSPSALREGISAQSIPFERLVAIVADEHRRDAYIYSGAHEARIVDHAKRLLAGERVEPSILDYELSGYHLALVIRSASARPTLRQLADDLGYRHLIMHGSSEETWVWLGRFREPPDPKAIRSWLSKDERLPGPIGLGEPHKGLDGWRLTHEQGRAALWVAQRRSGSIVGYSEAALLASMGGDRVLTASLREKYLIPLDDTHTNGRILRATLRAYFRADRNTSSAAAALGVSRQTVSKRLRMVEDCVGQPLSECADALHAALGLEELKLFES